NSPSGKDFQGFTVLAGEAFHRIPVQCSNVHDEMPYEASLTSRIQTPFTRDTLQGMRTPVREPQTRAGNQILDRAGDEGFAGIGHSCDARADVHGDAGNRVVMEFHFTRVQASSD